MRLAELIVKRRAATGESFAAMAERALNKGLMINRATIHHLTKDNMTEWPRPETVRALAAALDVTVTDILDAAAESLGLSVVRPAGDTPQVRAWVALTGERTEEEVEHLLTGARAVAAALDSQRQTGEPDHPV